MAVLKSDLPQGALDLVIDARFYSMRNASNGSICDALRAGR
jgi:hypothetical protein